MRTLVVLAHPNIESSQVNAVWAAELHKRPETITLQNIYHAYPDWNIDVTREQVLLARHDRIILQFPVYWYSVPPLLKKWIDDVFLYGWAYGPGGNRLAGKEIGLAVSTGSPADAYQKNGRLGYTLDELLRPLEQTIRFIKARPLPTFVMHGANHPIPEDVLYRNALDYVDHLHKQYDYANVGSRSIGSGD
ncbi:putative NADPH-quinone reductase [Paraburkholderia sp. CI2]|uniref:NAD(P)H-dependent oxidoreductase n=1 Tax=Paraburkholderia sp. CI2 TaxID=2723093 RepID=UPI00161C8FCB|nr:NAD(P)H-dependent oxidoreductase [Paraburkholderia sp. CI2]MBB5466827.1 putative NADPH-quinone reductase [Paraburkholderia sp. CI2]